MSKLREKLLKAIQGMVIRKGMNEITDECEQITDDFAVKFAEWIGTNYLKLNGVWVGMYKDQRNKDNWETTTKLLQIFKDKYYE